MRKSQKNEVARPRNMEFSNLSYTTLWIVSPWADYATMEFTRRYIYRLKCTSIGCYEVRRSDALTIYVWRRSLHSTYIFVSLFKFQTTGAREGQSHREGHSTFTGERDFCFQTFCFVWGVEGLGFLPLVAMVAQWQTQRGWLAKLAQHSWQVKEL